MLKPSTRTTVQYRDFICKGESHHRFRSAVRLQVADDGNAIERSAQFMPLGADGWSALPLCISCDGIAEERETYDPSLAAVPEKERFEAWLSPDGQRLAVPGKRGAVMPDRYVAAGYRRVEAHSMRDQDRLDAIRARQTGNEVYSEMNFSHESRRWHEEAPYDSEDMTSNVY